MIEEQQHDEIIEMHAIIHGYVQGVFFRATTRDCAHQLGITGTVKNLSDGTVEIFAQGPRARLNQLLDYLQSKRGPGHVDRLEKEYYPPHREFEDFRVIY